MLLGHEDYFELFVFKETAGIGRALKMGSRSYPFVREIYKGNFCKSISAPGKEHDSKSLEILYQ